MRKEAQSAVGAGGGASDAFLIVAKPITEMAGTEEKTAKPLKLRFIFNPPNKAANSTSCDVDARMM
jgi:hypothetical protein